MLPELILPIQPNILPTAGCHTVLEIQTQYLTELGFPEVIKCSLAVMQVPDQHKHHLQITSVLTLVYPT